MSRKDLRKFFQENFVKKTTKRIVEKNAKDVFLTLVLLNDVNITLNDFSHLGTKFSVDNIKTAKNLFNQFSKDLEKQEKENKS